MKLKLLLHAIVLASLVWFGKWVLIIWFHSAVVYYLYRLWQRTDKGYQLASLLLYLIPLEILGRILYASPYIPYESGKYISSIALIFALTQIDIKRGKWAIFILVFLIPGAIMSNPENPFKYFVFNILGLMNLGLAVLAFSNVTIDKSQLKSLVRNALVPVFVLLFYLMLVSPNIFSVDHTILHRESDVFTGNFGSNQVSTVLGYGIVLMAFGMLNQRKITFSIIADGILFYLIIFWILLSFSRGGPVGAVISILVLACYKVLSNRQEHRLNWKSFLLIVSVFSVSFISVNMVTKGELAYNYWDQRATALVRNTRQMLLKKETQQTPYTLNAPDTTTTIAQKTPAETRKNPLSASDSITPTEPSPAKKQKVIHQTEQNTNQEYAATTGQKENTPDQKSTNPNVEKKSKKRENPKRPMDRRTHDNFYNIDKLTSNRITILLRDLKVWRKSPILGVGGGNSKVIGAKYDMTNRSYSAHIEISRLIAEHGIFGFLLIFLIYFYPFYLWHKAKGHFNKSWMLILLIYALFATIHSATRTMISPILFGMAFLQFHEKE